MEMHGRFKGFVTTDFADFTDFGGCGEMLSSIREIFEIRGRLPKWIWGFRGVSGLRHSVIWTERLPPKERKKDE